MSDFSNWSQKDFVRWLHKNYPDPPNRWVEVTLAVHHAPGLIFKCTLADEYGTCMRELVINAAGLPEERWDILIAPAKRRKKKQMWLSHPILNPS